MALPDRSTARWTAAANEADLLVEYRSLALTISNDYFIPGADRDDVEQEALIGLMIACRDVDGRGAFGGYAWMVIHRWLQTCVSAARRDKHLPLLDVVWDADLTLIPGGADPVRALDQAEELRRVRRGYQGLTVIEREALSLVTNGYEYASRPDHKRIDNAVQRARQKLREAA